MAEWSRNKVDSTQLNNGNEFDNNSDFTLDEMNAIVNGGLYSQDFAEHLADAPDISEANNTGTVTIAFVDNIVNGKTYKKFKFSNLKGQKGDTGETGATGATPNISVSATTLSPGSQATATRSGTNENPHITFGIPKGEPGDAGDFDDSLSETSTNAVQNKIITNELNKKENKRISTDTKSFITTKTWSPKTWNGLEDLEDGLYGDYIWTDNNNIYYSQYGVHKVLDEATSTWSPKTWNGLSNVAFYGNRVWRTNNNIYYSMMNENFGNYQLILDKTTSTWSPKTWNGLTEFDAHWIWSDGEDIYCSAGTSHYVLDEETSTWSIKTWNGDTDFSGGDVWTDGENIYLGEFYILDKATSTWLPKTWNEIFDTFQIWSDGENIYLREFYILDKATSTWQLNNSVNIPIINSALGYKSVSWTDGKNSYLSYGDNQYVLKNIKFVR